ncbi:LysR family transcriptional regulator [Curvibacter microcysteis]|uniref:LysR family transcriptional regulator n=1 Tax=Curvibacter microcysteis TaxID=3026419 RepID=UPI003081F9D2
MDRLQSMKVFQAVVSEGGFAAAARKMDLSPAVVTRLVEDLEQHLGTRLLQRTTRKNALTEAGTAYLARLRVILSDIEEAEASMRAHTQEVAGLLRIQAQPVMAVHILAPQVAEFRRLYPRVSLDIHTSSTSDLTIEDFDLTLVGAGSEFDANVIARPIVSSVGIVCASPRYLRAAGTLREPEDLRRHACLRLRMPSVRPGVWRLMNPDDGDRALEVQVEPALVVDHTDTVLQAAISGAGVCSLPMDLAAPYLRNGQLRRVLSPWITARFTLYAAMPSRKFVPARTRAFLDFIIERTRWMLAEAERTWPSPSLAPQLVAPEGACPPCPPCPSQAAADVGDPQPDALLAPPAALAPQPTPEAASEAPAKRPRGRPAARRPAPKA